MQLLFCDETNLTPTKYADFFLYGGLAFVSSEVGQLTREIDFIRTSKGFSPEDSLKFRTSARSSSISVDDWTDAKKEVVKACCNHGAVLIAALIHHEIVGGRPDKITDWQLNTVLKTFNDRLVSNDHDSGVVIIDRVGAQVEYTLLKDKFTLGGETPSGRRVIFDQIVAFASTCDGASHLASAADIVLGSLGFCLNHRKTAHPVCPRIFQSLVPLIPDSSPAKPYGSTVIISPLNIVKRSLLAEYRELSGYFKRLSTEAISS